MDNQNVISPDMVNVAYNTYQEYDTANNSASISDSEQTEEVIPEVDYSNNSQMEEEKPILNSNTSQKSYSIQYDQDVHNVLNKAGGFNGNRFAEIMILVLIVAIIAVGGFFIFRHFTSKTDEPQEEEPAEDVEAQPLTDTVEAKRTEAEAPAEQPSS